MVGPEQCPPASGPDRVVRALRSIGISLHTLRVPGAPFGVTSELHKSQGHTVSGHSHAALRDAVIAAKNNRIQPSAIIAHTRKGYLGGDRVLLNGAHSGTLTLEEFEQAIDFLMRSA